MILTRRTWVIIMAVAAIAAAIYFAFDPMESPWMPKCMLHALTGLDCPGCGSQRAIHALLHGDIGAALRANALLVASIPFLLLMLYAELFRNRVPRLFRLIYRPLSVWIMLIVIVGWGIIRNFM